MKTSSWFVLALGALFVFGELVLAISLFRLQVLNVADSRESQEIQTIRRVRVPGLRGRILDCKDRVLAECRRSYCISCNLEEFQRRGATSYTVAAIDADICLESHWTPLTKKETLDDMLADANEAQEE